jgi:hypothetical protein
MDALTVTLIVMALGSGPAAASDVRGVLATPVSFGDEAGAKLASAILDLLATSTYSRVATGEEWLDAGRRCHVRVKFQAPPRSVAVDGGVKLEVAEVIATFPLASTGGLWVRSGDRYAYFAKYSGPALGEIQTLLREAKPAE